MERGCARRSDFGKEKAVCEIAEATEVVDGEWDECDVGRVEVGDNWVSELGAISIVVCSEGPLGMVGRVEQARCRIGKVTGFVGGDVDGEVVVLGSGGLGSE